MASPCLSMCRGPGGPQGPGLGEELTAEWPSRDREAIAGLTNLCSGRGWRTFSAGPSVLFLSSLPPAHLLQLDLALLQ